MRLRINNIEMYKEYVSVEKMRDTSSQEQRKKPKRKYKKLED